jgi:hypothetical protein
MQSSKYIQTRGCTLIYKTIVYGLNPDTGTTIYKGIQYLQFLSTRFSGGNLNVMCQEYLQLSPILLS